MSPIPTRAASSASQGAVAEIRCAPVKSTPIAEWAIISAAIGAAIFGFKPVAEIILLNFTTMAMDMIVNHAAKLRFMSGGQTSVAVVICTMTGAGMGNGGQHSDFLEACFAHTAGLKVVIPSNPADAHGLMLDCIADPDLCIFAEKMTSLLRKGDAPERGKAIPLGKARLVREGRPQPGATGCKVARGASL